MTVNLSPVGGVAAQFFDNDGNVLSGGKIYTYVAGTSTPTPTYTTAAGNIAHSNPIVLDSGGRVPTGEIWLTDGVLYKFVLKDSGDALIATYDNISGINSNAVAYTNQQEIVTATAGQTVFDLTITYAPGTNSLSVFVDGVNQYGPGAQYAYTETDQNTVTFNSGLHVGAEVKFTTTQQQGAGAVDASQVSYNPPFTNATSSNVEDKLKLFITPQDFGAVGDGATNDYTAWANAVSYCNSQDLTLFAPNTGASYKIDSALNINCKFTAGDYRVFSGSGTITIAAGCVETMYSAWFDNDTPTSTIFATGNVPNWVKLDTGVEHKIRDDAPDATTYQTRTFVSGAGVDGDDVGVGAYRIDVSDSQAVIDDPTKAGILYGIVVTIDPVVARNDIPNDDATGILVQNGGTQKATDAFYVGRNPGVSGVDWNAIFSSDAWASVGISLNGYHEGYGIDLGTGTFLLAAMRLPNNVVISARNAANTDDIPIIKLASDDVVQLGRGTSAGSAAKLANTAGGYLKFEISSNSASQPSITFSNTLQVGGAYRQVPVAVASLPSASIAGAGARHFVSDSSVTTFSSVVSGGGASPIPVYSDGTNWRVG